MNKALALLGLLSSFLIMGCATAPLGKVMRFDDHGQQVICWEPGLKFNGLTRLLADKMEGK